MSIPVTEFLVAGCVAPDFNHGLGTLEKAEAIRSLHPDVGTANIYTAAVLGDDATVQQLLGTDTVNATAKGGPYGWDALTHLCFSKYLRLDRARAPGFRLAAQALLTAGASANTGFFGNTDQPKPEFECVLYGAAGIAHDAELTRLLLERGADPNDGEVVYHTPESWDNAALKILVLSGKLTQESLGTILLRKTDWHDREGIAWLLEQGVDPDVMTHWGKTALHNAVLRDNALEIFEELLAHGADPTLKGARPEVFRSAPGQSAVALAARRGRGDVLGLFQKRGIPIELEGVDRLIAACASNNTGALESIAQQQPELKHQLYAEGGKLLADFAGNGNTAGLGHLLDLGVDIRALDEQGDGYYDIAKHSSALHVAAWRARHATVKFLMARGAPINQPDGQGRTPLALAVRACVDSYWKERRSPESVRALLEAGAAVGGVSFPSGYAEVDALLHNAQRAT